MWSLPEDQLTKTQATVAVATVGEDCDPKEGS
jgi:hypothetical protein